MRKRHTGRTWGSQRCDYRCEYNSENVRISVENKETKWSYLVDPQATYSQILITETYEKNLLGQFTKLIGTTKYFYGLGLISEESKENGYLLYHFDQLGSTKRVTDQDGKTVYTMTYGSYGELFGIKDEKNNLIEQKNCPISFLYNGQYGIVTDQNTLYYMRARYYNTEIKRFINQDVVTGSIDNSQSLNRYSYVQGNPIRFIDPFGLCPDGSGIEEFENKIKDTCNSIFKSISKEVYNSLPEEQQKSIDEAVAKANAFMQKHAKEINMIKTATKIYRDKMRKALAIPHIVLGVAGCFPVLGAIPDVLDAYLCLMELDFVGAAFSFGCAAASFVTPGVDQTLGILKTTRSAVRLGNVVSAGNALKNISKGADIAKGAGTFVDLVKGADNIADLGMAGKTANHIADGVKNASNAVDAAKGASNVGDVASVGSKIENVAEAVPMSAKILGQGDV